MRPMWSMLPAQTGRHRYRRNHYTRVSCKLYDLHNLCCSNYPERLKQVPECLHLRPVDLNIYRWLPKTCAYRRLSEGKNLLTWHPLISGQQDSVVEAGISIRNIAISETDIPPNPDWEEYVWEERVIRWVEIKEED